MKKENIVLSLIVATFIIGTVTLIISVTNDYNHKLMEKQSPENHQQRRVIEPSTRGATMINNGTMNVNRMVFEATEPSIEETHVHKKTSAPASVPNPTTIILQSQDSGREFMIQPGTEVLYTCPLHWTLSYQPSLLSSSEYTIRTPQGIVPYGANVDGDFVAFRNLSQQDLYVKFTLTPAGQQVPKIVGYRWTLNPFRRHY